MLKLIQRRGLVTQVAVAILVVLALFVGIRMIGTTQATSGGDPYSVPIALDVNPDPDIFETTIVADEATVDIGNGVMANVQTFNGQLPGPEFKLKVGDTVIVHFKNQLDHATGIHWHGIELDNRSDGTPLSQNQVPPGGSFLYKFKVTRPGIYWYHPHHHSSTNQVFKGLYGPIIITDQDDLDLQAAGVIPPGSQTRTLALSDLTVCKAPGSNDTATYPSTAVHVSGASPFPSQAAPNPIDLCETGPPIDEDGNARGPYAAGDVPAIQQNDGSGRTNEGQTVLTNGKNVGPRPGTPTAPGPLDLTAASALDVLAGQGLRLQIGNTATIRFFRLILTDNSGTQIPLVRIGGQGGLLDQARVEGGVIAGFDFKYTSGEILLDPGDRADVVASIPASASIGDNLTLWTQDFKRVGNGGGFANTATVPVMHLHVTGVAGSTFTLNAGDALRTSGLITGTPVTALGAATASFLNPAAFAPPKAGLPSQDIHLNNNVPPPAGVIGALGIDNVVGEHDFPGDYTLVPHPDSNRYAAAASPGDTLELQVTNVTNAHHPFHLHGFSIQPLDLTDTQGGAQPLPAGIGPSYTFPYHEFRDNVDVPGGYTLRFRVKLDERPLIDGVTPGGELGRWVFHCHIFFHATFGMISEFDVVDASGNERPYVNSDAASVEVNEGQVAAMNGTYMDPDGDAVTLSGPAIGTLVDNGDGTWSWSYTTTNGPDESQVLYVTATDAGGHKDQVAFQLVVNNLPPDITITSPPTGSLYKVGDPVTVTASVTDPGTADVLTCNYNWDGGGAPSASPVVAGSCSGTNTFTQAGVYTVTVTADDGDGGTDSDTVMIVVYDPSAGFVTGGGTINSPPGAYIANPSLIGKANFGFVSKYLKGAKVPTGETEFQFQAGGFNFHSTSYQWLVISGPKAQYRGLGTVNGGGNFGFLLTATDGKLPGGGGVDKIRMKVWDKSAGNAVVYDNRLGLPEDIDTADPQAIATGSIVVHKGK